MVAGLLLVGDFALDNPYDPTPSGPTWLGAANDVVGIVQFAAFAPVVWALRRRLPTTRSVRVSTVAAVAAAIAYVSILLVAGVMTFQQQIGLLIVMIVVIYVWLLIANLAAHRFRTLPRSVTLFGVMVGVGLLVGLVLVGASLVVPNPVGQIIGWPGYILGFLGWLGLPVYSLLLAAKVFKRSDDGPNHGLARRRLSPNSTSDCGRC